MHLKTPIIISGVLGLLQAGLWIPQLLVVGYHLAIFIVGSGAVAGLSMSFIGLMKEKKNPEDPGVDSFTKPGLWIMVLIMAILMEFVWIATLVVNIIVFGPLLGEQIYLCYVFTLPGAILAALSVCFAVIGLVRTAHHIAPTDYHQI